MERYSVQRITGGSMDELESNLRSFLNGLEDDEQCVSLSMGLKEALIVTVKGIVPSIPPMPAPVQITPPPPTPMVPAPEPVFDASGQARAGGPVAAPVPTPPVPAPAPPVPAVAERPKTVQFIPVQRPAQVPPVVEEIVEVNQEPPVAPTGHAPLQRPDLIFRKCPYCDNQLILPHVPISVMCPHCKSTVTIDE